MVGEDKAAFIACEKNRYGKRRICEQQTLLSVGRNSEPCKVAIEFSQHIGLSTHSQIDQTPCIINWQERHAKYTPCRFIVIVSKKTGGGTLIYKRETLSLNV